MKNQYFGDVNDYRKYGLLRALSRRGAVTLAVCWMLTPSDGGGDGKFVQYLRQPKPWRCFDPELYEWLRERVVDQRERDVRDIECSGLLPRARFCADMLPDEAGGRARYFEDLWQAAEGCDLLFFDPDNGMEVKSKPYGRKGSSKYLYWRELEAAWCEGHSLLVYQHFRREKRDPFIARMAAQMRERVQAPVVISFRTAHVVFLLLPQCDHLGALAPGIAAVRAAWSGQIKVAEHRGR